MTFFAMTNGKAHSTDQRGFLRVAAISAFVLGGSACFAQSELARYIAPETPVLAGMRAVPPDERGNLMWLATKNNAADLSQLVEVTGVDPGRKLDEVIATDFASRTESLGNHLLLAKGRFDYGVIATEERAHGAKEIEYRGVPVLVMEAPHNSAQGPRWFAVPKRDVAMVGTAEAVAQALDRSIENAEADPRIEGRLIHVPRRDAAWSSIAIGPAQVRPQLAEDASRVGRCLGSTGEFMLGIDPGSTVEIDMKTTAKQGAAETAACLSNSIFGGGARLVRVAANTADGATLKIKLRREEYERWLNSFRGGHEDNLLEAMVGSRDGAGRGR